MRMQRQFARTVGGIVVLIVTTVLGVMNAPWILAQSPPRGPTLNPAGQKLGFEVASIRPVALPCARTSATDAGRVERGCTSLDEMLRLDIGIPQTRLVAPDWIGEGQKFDISAKLPAGANLDQIPQMFQSLLEDRFGLTFHRESRERPIYALVMAKGGLKVQPAAPESAQPAWVAAAASSPVSSRGFVAGTRFHFFLVTGSDGLRMSIIQTPGTGFVWRSVREPEGIIHFEAPSTTFEGLADLAVMAMSLGPEDTVVRDMTGLKGRYQVNLDVSSADVNAELRAHPADPAALRDAQVRVVQDAFRKLGLQLEARKAPVEMVVIDHLEQTPTQN
jgi:uncharacterized protein (TIGR03435 family)